MSLSMFGRKFKRKYKYCLLPVSITFLFILAIWHSNEDVYHKPKDVATIASCMVQKNIFYLKIHKTASSSVLNICMRFAIDHDVLMAIPRQYIYFGHPKPFDEEMVPKLNSGYKYNILCHHTRFSFQNVRKFMPEDAILFTMLREPTALFESAFTYYHLEDEFGMSLEQFVNGSTLTWHNRRFGGRIGRNQMAFDLGVNESQFDNETAIEQIAENLNKQFHLIMINERINESLVLLKNLLCWTTDDVVMLHINARKDTVKKTLNPEIKSKILKWNKADKILYDYFLKKFDEKVIAFGAENMKKEKAEIQARTEMWYSYCIEETTSIQGSDLKQLKLRKITNITCEYLTKDELKFDNQIIKRQRPFRYIQSPNKDKRSLAVAPNINADTIDISKSL